MGLQNHSKMWQKMMLGGIESKPSQNDWELYTFYPITRSTSSDFRRSPRVGRSSWQSNGGDPNERSSKRHSSNSDCFSSSSSTEDAQNRRECSCGAHNDKACEHNNCTTVKNGPLTNDEEKCENMALSAAMMRGGSGGRPQNKQKTSSQTVSDIDNETSWTVDSSDSRSPTPTRCICDKLKSKETVILNVGGKRFETYKSTLRRLRTCKLASKREMLKYYREEQGDFFFDRDPYAFNIVLNYLRYGDLHLPTNLCGPTLMRELEFWGVDEQDIERCCFQPYNTWKTQTRSLEKLEYDRKQSTTQTDLAHDRRSSNIWRRVRAIVWPFLQDPSSSRAAKMYAWVSTIFVFMSIFSFCAETHPFFKVSPADVQDIRVLYQFFAWEDSKVMAAHATSAQRLNSVQPNFNESDLNETHKTDTTNNTLPDPHSESIQHPALLIIDLVCVFFFTLEFLTRLLFCPKKRRFCTSLQNIIDFVAIVPDYVEFIILIVSPNVREGLGFVDFIFILRMLRLCRLFRLIRHVPGLWILLYTLKASFNELLLMFVFLLIGMVMFASLLHFIEGGEKFSNIPVGFWWAVVTMTTVGYGDMYPVTGLGYVIGSVCAISGLLMIAFTVPIIVSNFVLYYTHVQYGICDKEDVLHDHEYDPNDDLDNCSFHTTFTETSEDLRNKAKILEKQKKEEKTKSIKVIPKNMSNDNCVNQKMDCITEIETNPSHNIEGIIDAEKDKSKTIEGLKEAEKIEIHKMDGLIDRDKNSNRL